LILKSEGPDACFSTRHRDKKDPTPCKSKVAQGDEFPMNPRGKCLEVCSVCSPLRCYGGRASTQGGFILSLPCYLRAGAHCTGSLPARVLLSSATKIASKGFAPGPNGLASETPAGFYADTTTSPCLLPTSRWGSSPPRRARMVQDEPGGQQR
jgi:hypothetical protein